MDAGRICSDLVALRSENPPGCTAEVIDYIRAFFDDLGIRSKVTGHASGHCNLITRGTHNRILLCGHVDVVPALDEGWTYPPFSGHREGDYVWGRGATDMKGGCAALLAAVNRMVEQESGELPTCAFVCDEETGGEKGILYLLAKKMIRPTDCLIAEPTPVRHPSIGQKGLCRFRMKFRGTPGHGSLYPAVGISAVMEAVSLLQYVKSLHDQEYPVDSWLREIIASSTGVLEREFRIHDVSEVLTRLMFNPGVISGGEKSNVVAQHCELDLELRVPWGCRVPELIAGLQSHAPHGKILSQAAHDPSITDPSCRLVRITCSEVDRVYGGPVFPIVQWAASDARHLRLRGFRVVQYGPGVIPTLHAVDERVSVRNLDKASAIYLGIMNRYARDEG